MHTVGSVAEATHGGRYAALLRGRREGTAAEGIRRGGADRAGGPVPQLVTALRPRVGDDPKRHVGSTRSSFTVVARPSLSTSVRLASRARVLGGRSRRARVDRSMQRHYLDLKWEADRPGTSPSEARQGRPPWSRCWLRTSR